MDHASHLLRTAGCDRLEGLSGSDIAFHRPRQMCTVLRLSRRSYLSLHPECGVIGSNRTPNVGTQDSLIPFSTRWNRTPNVGTQDVLIRFSPRAAHVSRRDCDDRDIPSTRVA